MLFSKTISIDDFKLEPPRSDLNPKDEKLANELLEIFSLKEVTKFNNNYKLETLYDAEQRIYNISLAFQRQLYYTYLLYDTKVDRLVGTIELLAPISVNESHKSISKFCFLSGDAVRNNIWLIEYYLHPDYWRQGIMTKAVSGIIDELFHQNVGCIAAVCHNRNTAGTKFLSNLKFIHMIRYKNMPDHFLWIKKPSRSQE
ncbi:MAG TPA: GNAT family N-acetyltransferase [Bacteroidia bacterium]|jgi:RimJ/RimL family protein N-acetyltransferase